MVSNCSLRADFVKTQPMEPLKPTVPPKLPWQKIGTDLFDSRGMLFTLCVLSQQVPTSYKDGVFEKQRVVVEELKRQLESMGSQHKGSQIMTPIQQK